jgi:glycerol-3-phosphate O-acyltransferase
MLIVVFDSTHTHTHTHTHLVVVVAVARQSGIPLVLLPTHKSHVDYMLVTFICFRYNIPIPHVLNFVCMCARRQQRVRGTGRVR